MAPIVVPGVCRFSVNQRLGGQPVVNVLDMQIDTTGSVVNRADACETVAKDIMDAWHGNFRTVQVDDLTCLDVSWLDINSLTGSRGTVTTTDDNEWPANGGVASNDAMPAVIAMRIDKTTSGGRGSRQGRMYLGGVLESWTDSGVTQSWAPGAIEEVTGIAGAFLDAVSDQEFIADVQRQLVVVHDVTGSSPSYSEVTALTVNAQIATQVRRGSLR